jgi:hypothetical protein
MAKKRVYKRAKNGQFGSGSGTSRKGSKATTTKRKRVGGTALQRGQGKIAKTLGKRRSSLTQSQVRKRRNQLALKKLRAQGIKLPKGTLAKIQNLKKGESVKLPGGAVISRSSTNNYTVKKPKAKKGK